MTLTLETIGAVLGAGLASAGIVITAARRWITKPAEQKLDAMSVELGVGVGPSIASLVMTTAGTVQRLEEGLGGSGRRIENIIRVQGEHAAQLLDHEGRIVFIESRRETCSFSNEQAACLLAQKTERVAEALAIKTETVAETLAVKTEKTAEALAQAKPSRRRQR
jgi:hypothetical protein